MKKVLLSLFVFSILVLSASAPALAEQSERANRTEVDIYMYCRVDDVRYELGEVIKKFGKYEKAVVGCCKITGTCTSLYLSNAEGDGYLHSLTQIAAKYNHFAALKYLVNNKNCKYETWPLKRGSDGYHYDYKDYTELMYAVKNGNVKMVEFLLEKGANPRLKNMYGQDSFDLAEKSTPEVKAAIREAWQSYRSSLDTKYRKEIIDLKYDTSYEDMFADLMDNLKFNGI